MSHGRISSHEPKPASDITPTPCPGGAIFDDIGARRVHTDSPASSEQGSHGAAAVGGTALHCKNRRGDTYYLQEGKTPTGKPRYYAGKELTGTPLAALPQGHEFYERPDSAQVIVRKMQSSPITELERQQAERTVARATGIEQCVVAIEGSALVVYAPVEVRREADKILKVLGEKLSGFGIEAARADAFRERHMLDARYSKLLRFELIDAASRTYRAERWGYQGWTEWTRMPGDGPLAQLIESHSKHLGENSLPILIPSRK